MILQVAVWDTYVKRRDGATMHFDIIVPDGTAEARVHEIGRAYLMEKRQEAQPFTSRECRFCHVEHADEETLAGIRAHGYFIYEMENCH
ncbi:MAG: hypothetical protein PCFJNLEI_01716 [Verrucomicrobiae bacterium]|nr:hypothetical protein [Verrucomicrobiae bacterium]